MLFYLVSDFIHKRSKLSQLFTNGYVCECSVSFFRGSACARTHSAAGAASGAAPGTATSRGTRGGHQARTGRYTHTGSDRSSCAGGGAGAQTVSRHCGEDRSCGPAGPGTSRKTGARSGRSTGACPGPGTETVSCRFREDRTRRPTVPGTRGCAGARAEAVSSSGCHTRALQVTWLVMHIELSFM